MTAKMIAIDGPAGAGKSTVAKEVARRLNYLYIDTGAMYRAVAYKALQLGLAVQQEAALTELAQQMKIDLVDSPSGYFVYVDGEDLSQLIRLPQVGNLASPVSAILGVREALVAQQQRMAANGHVIMDGRDIGTKVLPDADCKIFLTADIRERAKRRTEELISRGEHANLNTVEQEIAARDQRDSTRANSPLKQADDAILLDTTLLSVEDVVARIIAIAQER